MPLLKIKVIKSIGKVKTIDKDSASKLTKFS